MQDLIGNIRYLTKRGDGDFARTKGEKGEKNGHLSREKPIYPLAKISVLGSIQRNLVRKHEAAHEQQAPTARDVTSSACFAADISGNPTDPDGRERLSDQEK
jgi:hypothetical protein